MPRLIKYLVIHCSDSRFGERNLIDQWHKQRGFRTIGYHYIITNGHLHNTRKYRSEYDGVIQVGRPVAEAGAHVKGYNKHSIGICLIGKHHFTEKQFTELRGLITEIKKIHPDARVVGHYELDDRKTCPNISGHFLRDVILA